MFAIDEGGVALSIESRGRGVEMVKREAIFGSTSSLGEILWLVAAGSRSGC